MKVPQNVQKTTIKNIQKKVTHRSRGARMMSMILAFLLAFQTPISFVYAEDGSETPVVTAAEVNTDAAAEEEAAAQAQAVAEVQAQAEAEVKAQAEAEAKAQAEAEQQTQSGEDSNTDPNTTPETEEESSKGTDANNEQSENSTTESTTESTTTESTTESGSESESDSESESETETEKHVAADVTNEMGQLHLNVGSAWYTNASGEKRDLAEMEGGVSYAEVDVDTLRAEGNLTAGFSVLYRLTENGEARTIRGTDYVMVHLPEWMTNVRLTENGQKIKSEEEEFDGASYEINNETHTLKITFKKAIDEENKTDINGTLGLAFDVEKSALPEAGSETASETTILLQSKDGNENRARLILPAKLQEESESESETETESEFETEEGLPLDADTMDALMDAIFARAEELGIAEDLTGILYPVMPLDVEDTTTTETETTETETTDFDYEASAGTQVIWQDQTPLEDSHSLLPGTITGSLKTTKKTVVTTRKSDGTTETETETEAEVTSSVKATFDKSGALDFTTGTAADNGFSDSYKVTATSANNLNFSVEAEGLPSQKTVTHTTTVTTKETTTTHGNDTENLTTETKVTETKTTVVTTTTEYTWDLEITQKTDTDDKGWYYMSIQQQEDGKTIYYMTPQTLFSAKVRIYSGDTPDDEIEPKKLQEALQVFVGNTKIEDENGGALTGFVGEPKTITYFLPLSSETNSNYAEYALYIYGLPECNPLTKEEYVYNVSAKNTASEEESAGAGKVCVALDDGSGDVLVQEIDNSESGNYGDVTDRLHQGGLMKMTRYGTTTYTATKYWMDDNYSARPTATWYLWRYSTNDGGYESGAPVRNEAGDQVKTTVSNTETTLTGVAVSFEKMLGNMKLPKYDPDGQEYVYYAKEEMSGDDARLYEMVYGTPTVSDNKLAGLTDTNPNYISHTEKKEDLSWNRGSDTSIYNGGSLCNRLKDTTTVGCIKEWKAGRYQNDLDDITVTFTLQSRPKAKDGAAQAAWEIARDDNGKEVTETLENFSATNMTDSVSASMPKYDSLGQELEYKWIESSIKKDGKEVDWDTKDGETIFRIPKNWENQAIDGEEYFVSKESTVKNEDGTTSQKITNQLVGTTRYDVWKIWNVNPDPSITVVLKQCSTNGSVTTYDYSMTSEYHESGTKDAIGDVWHLTITNLGHNQGIPLPKYDEDGCGYEYTVEEVENKQSLYHTDYKYNTRNTDVDMGKDGKPLTDADADVNNVDIINNPVVKGVQIRVRKVWLDDGDATTRDAVKIAVYRAKIEENPLDSDAVDGSYVPVKNTNGDIVVTLTAHMQWWSWVSVTEYSYTNADGITYVGTKAEIASAANVAESQITDVYEGGKYFIKEISMGEKEVNYNTLSQRGFPTIKGKDNAHGYEVFYENPATGSKTYGSVQDDFYTVYNRRIGQIDLDVTKEWLDGGQSAETRAALGAQIQLMAEEGEAASIQNVNGVGVVDLGNDSYGKSTYQQPIYKSDNRTAVSNIQTLTGEEDGTKATIHFYNLPKYDYQGKILHYSIQENDPDGKLAGEHYASTVNDVSYTADTSASGVYGTQDHDQKAVKVTNKRSGFKEVSFHKRWIDKAVYEAGNRPDIFLSLYYYDSTCTDGKAKPYQYIDRKWTESEGDGKYSWICTFSGLPRYDDNGAEIVYYATETSHTDMTQLDYVEVQFSTVDTVSGDTVNKPDKSTLTWVDDDDNYGYVVTYNADENTVGGKYTVNDAPWVLKTNDENGWCVLKEGGWFINEIRANVLINGKKVWENIPEGFPTEELPALTFVLNRTDSNKKAVEQVATIPNVQSTSLTSFDFQFKFNGENGQDANGKATGDPKNDGSGFIPKYNPVTGEIYTYAVGESVAGSDTLGIKTAYKSGEVNNYIITNTFVNSTGNTGNITITKTWDVDSTYKINKSKATAEGTFTVKRFYLNKKGDKYLTDNFSQTLYINPDEATGTFQNLLVTSPNGNPYFYYVTEGAINGYTEDVQVTANTVTMATPEQQAISGYPTDSGATQAFCFKRTSEDDATTATYAQAQVTAKNTYQLSDGDQVSLSIKKNWKDNGNWTGNNRTVTLRLYRYADNQSKGGKNNAITREALCEWKATGDGDTITTQFYYVDEKGNRLDTETNKGRNVSGEVTAASGEGASNASDAWTLTLSNLDKYAPNGSQWKYEIKEIDTDIYYTGKDKTSTQKSTNDNVITMNDLTNDNRTTLTVKKIWAQNGKLAQLDTKYALQVRKVTDASGSYGDWQWAQVFVESAGYTLPSGFEYTQTITAGESSVTFKNLPRSYGNGSDDYPLQWRAVEIKIGDVEVCFGEGDDEGCYDTAVKNSRLGNVPTIYTAEQYANLLYSPANQDTPGKNNGNSVSGSTSQITNTPLKSILSLKITKTWVGDQENAFGGRPTGDEGTWAVNFLIQRRTGTGEYKDIKTLSGDSQLVVTMTDENATLATTTSGDTQSYTLEVTGLPGHDDTGKTYQYIAREAVEKDGKWVAVKDSTDTTDAEDLYYGYKVSCNEDDSVEVKDNGKLVGYTDGVTNSLRTTTRTLTKVWEDEQQTRKDKTPKFTLWVKEEGTWEEASALWANAGTQIQPTSASVGTTGNAVAYTWSLLPEVAPNGKTYVYGVTEETVSGYTSAQYTGTTEKQKENTILVLDNKVTAGDTTKNTVQNHVTKLYLDKTFEGETNPLQAGDSVTLTLTGAGATSGYTATWTCTANTAASGSTTGSYTYSVEVKNGSTTIYQVENNSSNPVIKGLPMGSYTVKESAKMNGADASVGSPDGYLSLSAGQKVTLSSDEKGNTKLEVAGSNLTVSKSTDAAAYEDTVQVRNQKTQFSLRKTNESGDTTLEGAEFTLSGTFPARLGISGNVKLVTGENGLASATATVSGVANQTVDLGSLLIVGQTYSLTETKAPAGYILQSDLFTFEVKGTGELIAIGTNPEAYSITAATEGGVKDQITVTDKTISFSIVKYNESGEGLAGAEFSLYKGTEVSDSNLIKKGLTTAVDANTQKAQFTLDGATYSDLIVGGTYTLYETKAATGYALPRTDSDRIFTFKIGTDGTITAVTDGDSEQSSKFFVIDSTSKTTIKVTNLHEFKMVKLDDVKAASDATNAEITDDTLELTVSDTSGNALFTWGHKAGGYWLTKSDYATAGEGKDTLQYLIINTTNGIITGLPAGTYTVKETGTPKEYVSVSATFTLGEDGKLTIANGSTSVGSTTTATVDDQELNVLQITDKRLRGKAILTKTDKDSDSTLLDGVAFTLQKKDAAGEWKDQMTGLFTGKTYTYNETAGQTATGVAGDEGVLTITDLFYGDYHLVETASLDGYATVEVKGSGSEAAPVKWAFTVDQESCDATTGTATFTYGAKNPKTKLTLTKKADGDSVLLEGTVFTLTGEKFAGDYAGQTSLELTTDENGQILLEGVLVTGVEYTLTEKTPTDGYRICIGELKFTLDKDGKATVVGDAPGGYSDITAILTSGSYENAITVTNQQTGLTIYKKNEAKTSALAGTSFTLEGEKFAGDHKGETSLDLTTDENGEITLTGVLVAGVEYKLTETKPTDGYSLRTKTLIFKLDKKGVAHVEGSAPTGYTLVGLAEEGTTDNEVTVTDAQTTLNLIKKVTDDTILADTAFTITGEFAGAHKGETSIVLTTGEDGTITLPGELIVGKEYTLEETKPTDGYSARKGTCTFTLESDGEAKILGDAPEGYELEASQVEDGKYANTFTVTDKPTRFSIIKKGEGSTEPLAGTTFEISGKFAGEHKDDQSITFITGEDGTYTFTKVLIAEETYTLKEIAPTDGYSIRTEILTFKLDLHGKAYLEGNTPTGYEMTGLNTDSKEFANEVTVTDAQTDLSIIKKGEVSAEDTGDTTDPDNTDGDEGTDTGSTKLLADTTFTLTGEKFAGDYAGQTSLELTTDENGQILLEGVLVTGVEYTLTETNPTDGYNIRTGELKFKLEFDGEAKIIGEAPTGYELQVSKTEDGKYTNTITATDAQTSFDLVKKGKVYDEEGNVADPKLLKDTEFVLTGEKFAGEYEDETSINLTTDEKGEISLQGVLITGVEYTLKETKPTAGYQLLAGELKFQLELDSKAQVVGEAPQGYELTATQVEDGKYTNVFTVTDEPTNFSFGKRLVGDSLTTGVAEAQFTITPEEGKTLADGSDSYSWTSAENPEKLTELLVSGDTYTLTETLAPEGALSVTEDHQLSYKFTLDETGTLITPETPAEGSADGLTAEDDLVTIWDTPTIVLLRKTGTDLAASGKDLLAGCTFKITGRFAAGRYEGQEQTEAGEHTLMVTTDGTDITCLALKGRLITGETYTLEEVVAPDGYATGMHVSFTVTGAKRLKDGTAVTQIQLAEADQEKGYEITTEDSGYPVILQKDDPVELVLKKMAKEDASKALAGAEFTLTGVFAGESSESTKTITTDSNGCVDLSKQLIESREGKEYTYRLKETKAPDGYDLTEGEIIFKMVSADGEGRKARIELVQVTSDSLQSLVSIANPDEEVPVLTVANVLTPEPETESGNGTGSDQTTNPTKTGDTTAVWPYLFALAAAATALAGVEVRRKKQSHK